MNKRYENPSMEIISFSDSVYTNDVIVQSNGTGGSSDFEDLWGTNAAGLEF